MDATLAAALGDSGSSAIGIGDNPLEVAAARARIYAIYPLSKQIFQKIGHLEANFSAI